MSGFQAYVCGFMVDDAERVVLLRKLTPDWQRGKLNGVGGKLEYWREDPLAAMQREWGEETGDDTVWPWRRFASQGKKNVYICHFLLARVRQLPKLPAKNDVGEAFEFRFLKDLVNLPLAMLAPSLPWLLIAACWDQQPKLIEVYDL